MNVPSYRNFIQDNARWNDFVFRDDDIVISTPPKCGTTWTQMICALLVFQTPDLPKPLDQISPWLDQVLASLDDVRALLEAQDHRRIIKTHTPLDGIPFDDRVTYICVARDPRDVAVSWDNHMRNIDGEALMRQRGAAIGNADVEGFTIPQPEVEPTTVERIWQWVDDPDPLRGIDSLVHHVKTFWDVRDRPNIVMLHYDELQLDLIGRMRYLASRLGIDVPESLLPTLADAASFGHMKANAKRVAPNATDPLWLDTSQFFNSGKSGQWREHLSDDDAARFHARLAELASPDLIEWLVRS